MSRKSRAQARAIAVPLPRTQIEDKLHAEIRKPSEISDDDKSHMYLLMRAYYADVSETKFLENLEATTDVILLRDPYDAVQGFSTLLQRPMKGSYGRALAVFSGDTVVAKEYWGQKELGVAFLKYLFIQKIKRPLTPVYWMLRSKGYKAYLLMANNFGVHFPRYEFKTPARVQKMMHEFYSEICGEAYSPATGLIEPHDSKQRLRDGVAAVTDELRQELPRVEFFAKRNPRWSEGIELACTAEMTLFMPIYYFLKKTFFSGGDKRHDTTLRPV